MRETLLQSRSVHLVWRRRFFYSQGYIHAAEIARSNVTNDQTKLVTACRELQICVKGQALLADSLIVGKAGPGINLRVSMGGQCAIGAERDCMEFQVKVVATAGHGLGRKCSGVHDKIDEIFLC